MYKVTHPILLCLPREKAKCNRIRDMHLPTFVDQWYKRKKGWFVRVQYWVSSALCVVKWSPGRRIEKRKLGYSNGNYLLRTITWRLNNMQQGICNVVKPCKREDRYVRTYRLILRKDTPRLEPKTDCFPSTFLSNKMRINWMRIRSANFS